MDEIIKQVLLENNMKIHEIEYDYKTYFSYFDNGKQDYYVLLFMDYDGLIKLNEGESINNKHLDPKNIIVTLGSKGTYYNGELIPQNNPQQTIDVSGAGDTFVAAFALKFLETLEEKASIEYANEMAAKVVSKRGVATP